MPVHPSNLARVRRSLGILALSLCVGLPGCAQGLTSLGDVETRRRIEKAAADDSIPSAAEVGLAAGMQPTAVVEGP
ncbi:MAG: hypothetical protein DWQ37_11985 [Planctomycetota bacterium]|nr:MAG: hypothetical protein DWQ37_11985 [Planctomycetota bacterium]